MQHTRECVIYVNLVFLCFTVSKHSCKKEELPTLSTTSPTNITINAASSGGNIISDRNAGIMSRGVCWGVNGNHTTSNSKTNDGDGIG